MAGNEEAERGYLRLLRAPGRLLIRHNGTGEVLECPAAARVDYDENGIASIGVSDDGDAVDAGTAEWWREK